MGSVPSSLFRDEGSFWIIQDSTKHLLDVCVQLSNTYVRVQSIVCPVLSECSAKADVAIFLSLTERWCSLTLCPRVLPVCPM